MFTGSLKCVLMSFVTISRIIDVDYEWKSADSSRNGVLDSPVVLKPYLCVGFHIVFLSAATVTAH